ncbi:Uncharacterised protein [Bordetella pertussis]|nr:Uncharacterised protein [Bordetella pertussis]
MVLNSCFRIPRPPPSRSAGPGTHFACLFIASRATKALDAFILWR